MRDSQVRETGDFGAGLFLSKGKVMGFIETVDLLQRYHNRLWFNASQDVNQLSFCDRWRSGEILSGAGRLLAMQAGHPDQWELNFNHTKPDGPYEPDECDEGVLITRNFLVNVNIYMTYQVLNHINPQGDFIRDHTPDDQVDLSGIFGRHG